MRRLPYLIAAGSSLVALSILLFPPVPLEPAARGTAALVIATLGLWASGLVAEYFSSLLFLFIAAVFVLAPIPVVFSGFHSPANWTVLGGLFIGAAVRLTGLGARFAELLSRRFDTRYAVMVFGMMTIGVTLALLMPSAMARLAVLCPITVAFAARVGFEPGSRGHAGLCIAMAYGTTAPAAGILPANVPNLVFMGTSEAVHGVSTVYGEYFLLHFPVLGLLKALMIVPVIVWMFPAVPRRVRESAAPVPMSPAEGRLAVILVLALAAWMTDTVHHVSPAWVALAAAVACMLPGIGVLPANVFAGEVNLNPFIFTAAILGVGTLVSHVGLGELLGRELIDVVGYAPGGGIHAFVATIGIDMILGLFVMLPGIPAIMVPLSDGVAVASGLPIETVLMMHPVGHSTIFLPYQMPPLILAATLASIRMGDFTRFTIAMGFLSVIVLLPLDLLWWLALGKI
jgi:di/tricarboxylate transporter